MPGLVNETIAITARIAHGESKIAGIFPKPIKGFRILEGISQGTAAWGRYIDGPATVMLAVARRRVYAQHIRNFLPRSKLLADQLRLVIKTAEPGDQQQAHPCRCRRPDHRCPLRCGDRRQSLCPADEVRAHIDQLLRIRMIGRATVTAVISRYAELQMEYALIV